MASWARVWRLAPQGLLAPAFLSAVALVSLAACGPSAPANRGAAALVPTTPLTQPELIATVTCPDLGSMSLALPSGRVIPPASEVRVSVGYQATVARTHQTVAGGQPPGEIPCGTVPLPDQLARDILPGPLPSGVSPDDQLVGSWIVSVTVMAP